MCSELVFYRNGNGRARTRHTPSTVSLRDVACRLLLALNISVDRITDAYVKIARLAKCIARGN